VLRYIVASSSDSEKERGGGEAQIENQKVPNGIFRNR